MDQERLVNAVKMLGAMFFCPYLGDESAFWGAGQGVSSLRQAEIMRKNEWLGDLVIGDGSFEGYIMHPVVKGTEPTIFVKIMKEALGLEAGIKALKAYEIKEDGNMDRNLFWSRAMHMVGDLMFSQPTQTLLDELAGHGRKVYRYTFALSNPFSGSPLSYVAGHHFVEILYLFLTLTERYPTHRNKFLQRQAEKQHASGSDLRMDWSRGRNT